MSSDAASVGPGDRERLTAIRNAASLADLTGVTGEPTEHAAYFAAKREWWRLRDGELPPAPARTDGIPGAGVAVGDHRFVVHGVTHAGTDAERAFLRPRVRRYIDAGETVYCEQGIRSLHFDGIDGVCEMDDYEWATRRDEPSGERSFAGTLEELDSLTAPLQDAAFALVDAGVSLYCDRFRDLLGAVADAVFTTHESAATGEEFEAFSRRRRAAADPSRLGALQRYYGRAFLPQPLEREWLWRHDPDLERLTHARNERMADYAVYHNETVPTVHLVVGAAHQPGVRYYLEEHRDGERSADGFELVD